ncbi:hypothetical protein BdWA1_003921 [Babesia duncani]|uniref:Uncharacterized protein n=1 Tax=Babesia duncani TaxID=323732 RepID=A0AAD9PGS8_9APIC|nr:hypothetical protein BdWA1_004147 [Babesia duncani]KAK2194607.1 hypothetical protein BdWA1_003921 [Babesia duncani]
MLNTDGIHRFQRYLQRDIAGFGRHSNRLLRLGITISKVGSDTSIADDFDAPGYCKRESRLDLQSAEIQPAGVRCVSESLFFGL